ncbi:multiple epidermal growth factor domains protein 6 [Biomphalaria glabrata]|nr:multiple epidermal growth factor domains protein 6 [Biomphalaria glabrata]
MWRSYKLLFEWTGYCAVIIFFMNNDYKLIHGEENEMLLAANCCYVDDMCIKFVRSYINGSYVEESCEDPTRDKSNPTTIEQLLQIRDNCSGIRGLYNIEATRYNDTAYWWTADKSVILPTMMFLKVIPEDHFCALYDKNQAKIRTSNCRYRSSYMCIYSAEEKVFVEETTQPPPKVCPGCLAQSCLTCSIECEMGFYGEKCDSVCNSSCLLPCNKTSGSCELKAPNTTVKPCDAHCLNEDICKKPTVPCTHGCVTGYYGGRCEIACQPFCKNNKCEQQSGLCDEGCTENATGAECGKEETAKEVTEESSNLLTFILIPVLLILVLAAAMTSILFFRKRHHTRHDAEDNRRVKKNKKNTEEEDEEDSLELEDEDD